MDFFICLYALGVGIFSLFNLSIISDILSPFDTSLNILFTIHAVSGFGTRCPLSSGSLIYPKLGLLPINLPFTFLSLNIDFIFFDVSLLVISLNKALKGAISLFAESRKVSTLSSIEIYLTFFNGKYCSI